MITRRRTLGQTTAGAAIAGMWPRVPAAFAADTKVYNNPPPDVGPLIPADQEALTHFMALRYGVFIHWNPATVAGKRSEEHTSELQSLMRISYAVFGLKKKKLQ